MTATAFIDAIQKMAYLLPTQVEQLVRLAPFMTDSERSQTLASVQEDNVAIEENVKEGERIQTMVEQETQKMYKERWPKIKDAIQNEERESAASKLDEQIDAA